MMISDEIILRKGIRVGLERFDCARVACEIIELDCEPRALIQWQTPSSTPLEDIAFDRTAILPVIHNEPIEIVHECVIVHRHMIAGKCGEYHTIVIVVYEIIFNGEIIAWEANPVVTASDIVLPYDVPWRKMLTIFKVNCDSFIIAVVHSDDVSLDDIPVRAIG